MDERLYSRPLDVHRISDYPEVQRMITYLYDEMKSSGLIGKSPRKKILKHLQQEGEGNDSSRIQKKWVVKRVCTV